MSSDINTVTSLDIDAIISEFEQNDSCSRDVLETNHNVKVIIEKLFLLKNNLDRSIQGIAALSDSLQRNHSAICSPEFFTGELRDKINKASMEFEEYFHYLYESTCKIRGFNSHSSVNVIKALLDDLESEKLEGKQETFKLMRSIPHEFRN